MAATIQNIELPKKLRALDTSGNNNHGKIYSGRGLEFDGVTDYFQNNGGASLTGVNSFANGVSWTFACWMYFDSAGGGEDHLIGADFTSQHHFLFDYGSGLIKFRDANADYYTFSSKKLNTNTWYRIVVTTDGTSMTAYANGVVYGTIAANQANVAANDNFDTTEMKFTGWGMPYQSGSVRANGFTGMMSDGQVWDATWSADDAAYDYANPESLALNASGTALTESNLKVWYPMQDGHRGQQSYILDGASTGLGVNLITNGDFEGITLPAGSADEVGGWQNNTTTTNGWSIAGGKAFLDGEQDTTPLLRQDGVLSAPPDEGSVVYKCVVTISNRTAGNVRFNIGGYQTFESYDTNGTHTSIVKPTHTSSNTSAYIQGSSDFAGSIDNVEVYAINDKHHATTVFLGDDMWDLADDYDDGNWQAVAGSSVAAIGGATDGVKLTFGGTAKETNGSYIFLKDTGTNTLTTDLTVGRTYKLSGKFATDVAGATNAPRPAVAVGDTALYASPSTVPATNLVLNPGFETAGGGGADIWANWTEIAGSGTLANDTTGEHNGDDCASLTTVGGNFAKVEQNITVTAETTYLLSYWSKNTAASTAGDIRHQVIDLTADPDADIIAITKTGNETSSWKQDVIQFTTPTDCVLVKIVLYSPSGNHEAFIDDVVLTAFLEKEIEFVATHATANNFYHFNCDYNDTANEMIHIGSNANNSTFASTVGNWLVTDASGGNAAVTHSSSDGGFITINDTTDNETEGAALSVDYIKDIEIGRSYTVLVEMKAASGTPQVIVGYGGNNAAAQAITTSAVTYAYKVTPINTTSSLNVFTSSTSNIDIHVYNVQVFPHCNLYVDDISFKEVGVASGWTDADQQLDIAQPALQSYNELAWFPGVDPGVDYSINCTSGTSIDNVWVGGGTASAWIFPNSMGEGDKGRVFDKTYWHIHLITLSGNACKIRFEHGRATQNHTTTIDNHNIQLGEWNHIAITYDKSSPSTAAKIYINGVLQDATLTDYGGGPGGVGDVSDDAASTLYIGNTSSGSKTFGGCITEASLWTNTLTATEVLELYNEGKALDATLHSSYVSAASDLKGYWRNNGLSTWTDLSDNSNNGAVNNITETLLIPQGVDGSRDAQGFIMNRARNTSSLNLPNPDDVGAAPAGESGVAINNSPTVDITSDITICGWIKRKDNNHSYNIIQKKTGWNSAGYGLYYHTQGKWYVEYTDAAGSTAQKSHATMTIPLDEWYFICFTHDDSGNDVQYQASCLDTTLTVTTHGSAKANIATNTEPVLIGVGTGGSQASDSVNFSGQLDGFTIYNKTLTATEVLRNFKATKGSHRN